MTGTGIPNRLTRTAAPVFELHPRGHFHEPAAALVGIDPPAWVEVEAAGVCLAVGGVVRDPLSCDTLADYGAQPSCIRLALHDGPHAYLDLDAKVNTFTECLCVATYGFDECFHTADAVRTSSFVDPNLTIWIVDEVTA